MANLTFALVPAKAKKDGTNRIRLAVSHHSKTRYIVTEVIVENHQFRNGVVVNHPHAKQMNLKLNKLMGEYLDSLYSIDNPDSFTCEQITEMLRELHSPNEQILVSDAGNRMIQQYIRNGQEGTAQIHSISIKVFLEFAKDIPIGSITNDKAKKFVEWMITRKHYSSSSVYIKVSSMRRLVHFCMKNNLCKSRNPFRGLKIKKPGRRDTQISAKELKAISTFEYQTRSMKAIRDMFMLSFYLGGMNLVDMFQLRFDGDCIRYRRQKIKNRTDKYTTIPILSEARKIIDEHINDDGFLAFGKYRTYNIARSATNHFIKDLAKQVGITTPFTFYSARKTFIQIGVQKMIPLHILEYCCGETPKTDNPIQRYFVITKEIAGDAMRKIFDEIK